jgi:hypothetical protein
VNVSEIDEFASSLLEEAKRFLEKATDCDPGAEQNAHLHASLLLAFCSLDAHINAIATDFENRSELSPHDLSILLEREVRLEDGAFVLRQNLRIVRIEDRIQLLHRRLSGKAVDKAEKWWAELAAAITLRNELTHPKKVPSISVERVGRAVQAVIDTLSAMYLAIYKEKFPAANRGLVSDRNF